MKKLLTGLISFLFVINSFSIVLADGDDFNLVSFVNYNTIDSYSEFVDVINENTDYDISLDYPGSNAESYFNVYVDEHMNTVEVDVIFETLDSRGSKTATVEHETYNSSGALIYTVSVTGSFSYSTTSCTTNSASGSFTRPLFSFWSSTPTISSGNITTKKAYARISGTAKYLNSSSTYRLTLMCDNNGIITSSFTRP